MFNPPSPRRSTATTLPPGYQPPVHPQSLQGAPPPNTQPQAPAPAPVPAQPLQPPQTQAPQQPNRAKREAGQVQRVIPPEEDMRRLFQECRFAQGNAQLLSEALAFASPEDLREKDIIKVRIRIFLAKSEGADDGLRNGTRSASALRTWLLHKYHGRQSERIDRVLLVKLNNNYSSNSVQRSGQTD